MQEQAIRRVLSSLGAFSRYAAPRPLRPYQLEVGEAILRSILRGEGKTFTVLMARQTGKNELAAQLEAYLLNLYAPHGGTIVKAAPSFKPQIVNSDLRLREILSAPFCAGRWESHYGYMLQMGRARIMFFSAEPSANVVGATASILLSVDEAQDVDRDKYFRDFRPMASTTRATTVLSGTAWIEDTLLEEQRRYNRELEAHSGERLNFEVPWTTLAALSPAYRAFVEGEIARLGENHPTIRTQYLLEPVTGGGRLFPPMLLERLHGSHERQIVPKEGASYVAGVDVAGQVVQSGRPVLNDRDETVITIATVTREGTRPPHIQVVEHYCWRGLSYAEQYERLYHLLHEVWSVRRVAIDATGIGAGLASFLYQALPDRVDPVVFTNKSKSELGFALLGAAETGRLAIYRSDSGTCIREFWRQLRHTRYQLRSSEEMAFSVSEREGHDDFVMSLALCIRAAEATSAPAFGGIVRTPPTSDDVGW
jgi:hypothetical protein